MLSLALVQRTMDGMAQNKLSSLRLGFSPRAGVFAAAMALRTHRKI